MRLLITNIGILAGIDNHRKLRLSGKEMSQFETLTDAWLLVEDGRSANGAAWQQCQPKASAPTRLWMHRADA